MHLPNDESARPLWQTASFFFSMVGFLVFVNWGEPRGEGGLFAAIYAAKWWLASGFALVFAFALWRWIGVRGRDLALVIAGVTVVALLPGSHATWIVLAGIAGLVWLTAAAARRASGSTRPGLTRR